MTAAQTLSRRHTVDKSLPPAMKGFSAITIRSTRSSIQPLHAGAGRVRGGFDTFPTQARVSQPEILLSNPVHGLFWVMIFAKGLAVCQLAALGTSAAASHTLSINNWLSSVVVPCARRQQPWRRCRILLLPRARLLDSERVSPLSEEYLGVSAWTIMS